LVSWVAPANTGEGCLLVPSVEHGWRRWQWRPDIIVGDMGYIDAASKQRLRERLKVAVVTRLKENMKLVAPFETATEAVCPQGQPLRWLGYEADSSSHFDSRGSAFAICGYQLRGDRALSFPPMLIDRRGINAVVRPMASDAPVQYTGHLGL